MSVRASAARFKIKKSSLYNYLKRAKDGLNCNEDEPEANIDVAIRKAENRIEQYCQILSNK
jgi:hypothetical protein